jgi:hypothetical protein
MVAQVNKFILVAQPRSGSTYLIHKLAKALDAHLPDVGHEEIFNPYDKLRNCNGLGIDASSEMRAIDDYFDSVGDGVIGFKTMPMFHREWDGIIGRDDIRFITLYREDVLSALASYVVSEHVFKWLKPSRDQLAGEKVVFENVYKSRKRRERDWVRYIDRWLYELRAINQLNERSDVIPLTTEWLIHPGVSDERLAEFCGRRVTFDDFNAPTHYTECFEDHEFFKQMVLDLFQELTEHQTNVPPQIRKLHPDLSR